MGERQPWEDHHIEWCKSSNPDDMPGHIDDIIGPIEWCSKQGYVYVIESPAGHLVKIGKTINLQKRFSELQKLTRGAIRLLFYVSVIDAYDSELRLHERFYRSRKLGEWFALDDDGFEYLIELMRICRYQTEIVLKHIGA